jgi:hypothetical protein
MPSGQKPCPEESAGERQRLLRWAREHLAEYRKADQDGDDAALLQAATDLNTATSRLLELAECNGPVGQKRTGP